MALCCLPTIINIVVNFSIAFFLSGKEDDGDGIRPSRLGSRLGSGSTSASDGSTSGNLFPGSLSMDLLKSPLDNPIIGKLSSARKDRTPPSTVQQKKYSKSMPDFHSNGTSLNGTTETKDVEYHIVFSTDCGPYQRWQSYLLFYQALKIGQPGKITRIVSGCNEKDSKEELMWHEKYITKSMNDKFYIHLTPQFDSNSIHETEKSYEFFNKPFGLLHWMEHSPNMAFLNNQKQQTIHEDDIIILLDPDMVLLTPITLNMTTQELSNLQMSQAPNTKQNDNSTISLIHGKPIAQIYGLGEKWTSFNLTAITGPDSPAMSVSQNDARKFYPAGPPYIATAKDFYQIAIKWAEFAPYVHAQYPHLLAEMYAYCIAAAHLELPHTLYKSLMVSNTEVQEEGWSAIDKTEPEDICELGTTSVTHLPRPGPVLLHHCQRYMLADWFFGKRRVPHDLFSCTKSLLKIPPKELGSLYGYIIPPPDQGTNGPPRKKRDISPQRAKREAYMICALTKALNDASTFFKGRHCIVPNLDTTLELWHE